MANVRVVAAGAPFQSARAAAILLHGRGASAEDILGLADEFGQSDIAAIKAAMPPWPVHEPMRRFCPGRRVPPASSRGIHVI